MNKKHTDDLKRLILPKSTVYTLCNSVARSGMSRRISCYVVRDGEILNVTWLIGQALRLSLNDKGLLVHGSGMDMGFHLIDCLSSHIGYDIMQRWL